MLYESKLKHIGIQFFAESGEGDSTGGDTTQTETTTDNSTDNSTQTVEKTFTQEQVKALLAKEKKQGRRSVLRELGLDPEDAQSIAKAKTALESSKTDAEKAEEILKQATKDKDTAEQRAIIAERKLALLDSDCKKEYLDEVVTLVIANMTDDVDFNDAMAIVKEKCPSFFQSEKEDKPQTTGSSQGHKRQRIAKEEKGSLGSRLAKNASKNTVKENPYFKN